jgi:hypothetical protein
MELGNELKWDARNTPCPHPPNDPSWTRVLTHTLTHSSIHSSIHSLAHSSGVIFAVMNYTVHSVMYSYFAVNYVVGLIGGPKSTMKKTLSVVIGPIITAMQFTQMVLGLLVTIVAAYYAFIGHHVPTPTIVQHLPQYRNEAGNLKTYACRNSSFILAAAGLMYGSYFVLFGKLALAKLDQVTKACGKKKSA